MDTITTDFADKLEARHAAKKRAKRLQKPMPEEVDDEEVTPLEAPKTTKKKKVAASATKKTTKTKAKALSVPPPHDDWMDSAGEMADEYLPEFMQPSENTEDDEQRRQYEKMVAKAASNANKINLYYELFPGTVPMAADKRTGKPVYDQHTWSGMDDPEQIDIELARCQNMVNARHAPSTVKSAISAAAWGVEYAVMDKQINPMQWQLRGFRQLVERAMDDDEMKEDMAQLAIEYNDWCAQRPEMRLLQKISALGVACHTFNTGGFAPPSASVAAAVPVPKSTRVGL